MGVHPGLGPRTSFFSYSRTQCTNHNDDLNFYDYNDDNYVGDYDDNDYDASPLTRIYRHSALIIIMMMAMPIAMTI